MITEPSELKRRTQNITKNNKYNYEKNLRKRSKLVITLNKYGANPILFSGAYRIE